MWTDGKGGLAELRTSHRGYWSATAHAQEAAPYPQSSILLGRSRGGNRRRPSNVLFRTSCMICSRSISSYRAVSKSVDGSVLEGKVLHRQSARSRLGC
jgi:hypothetical protein